MSEKRNRFHRPLGERRYRKLFIIATEGAKTEPQYFALLDNKYSAVKVKCLRGKNKSAPGQVLKRMNEYIKKEGLKKTDEAWLVVDKDQWTNEQLSELFQWATSQSNYGMAVSNPKFEYWLLLHFEDASGLSSSKDCSDRLKKYLPDYDKTINVRQISQERIEKALSLAQKRDTPPCDAWPQNYGTTVYRLVMKMERT